MTGAWDPKVVGAQLVSADPETVLRGGQAMSCLFQRVWRRTCDSKVDSKVALEEWHVRRIVNLMASFLRATGLSLRPGSGMPFVTPTETDAWPRHVHEVIREFWFLRHVNEVKGVLAFFVFARDFFGLRDSGRAAAVEACAASYPDLAAAAWAGEISKHLASIVAEARPFVVEGFADAVLMDAFVDIMTEGRVTDISVEAAVGGF